MGFWVLWAYSRRAYGLVGIVGIFSTSLWASRYIVRRLLALGIICAAELTLIFFSSIKLNFQTIQSVVRTADVLQFF